MPPYNAADEHWTIGQNAQCRRATQKRILRAVDFHYGVALNR
jgi:hypothetical protein